MYTLIQIYQILNLLFKYQYVMSSVQCIFKQRRRYSVVYRMPDGTVIESSKPWFDSRCSSTSLYP